MTRFLLTLVLLLAAGTASAQSTIKFGYANCDSLLIQMPEYAAVQQQMDALKEKYQTEIDYNERTFKRNFTEFLEGQKNFTDNILLKRQRELQTQLRAGLSFRHEADSLLRAAEAEMLAPLRSRLRTALHAVGLEHGYEYILDTAREGVPFIHPGVGEDCTAYVREKLTHDAHR